MKQEAQTRNVPLMSHRSVLRLSRPSTPHNCAPWGVAQGPRESYRGLSDGPAHVPQKCPPLVPPMDNLQLRAMGSSSGPS
eukprot:1361256-Amorphochlora_amoeboformis.AAC.2